MLENITRHLAALGRLDRAAEAAEAITSPMLRRDARWDVIGAALRAGDVGRADAVADSIDSFGRFTRLEKLITGLSRGPARRLVARALATEHWQAAVGALSLVEPEAPAAILRELEVVDAWRAPGTA